MFWPACNTVSLTGFVTYTPASALEAKNKVTKDVEEMSVGSIMLLEMVDAR